ncbi:MAG: hypothetical protein WCI04_04165 [archaeon]
MKKIFFGLILLVSFFVLFGCVQPPVCGKGVCETGKNYQNCVADCPAPPVEYHSVCQNNACVQVSGIGTNECATDMNCVEVKSCGLIKKGNGHINFIVVPNRNITQAQIDSNQFVKIVNELFFGKKDAYEYVDAGGQKSLAPGFFDISPLNEYKAAVNIYYYNKTTALDCELANRQDTPGPANCMAGAETIKDSCKIELDLNKIDRVIVVDWNVGWDFASGVPGDMWFDNYKIDSYYVDSNTQLPFFDSGRVAAHEFGHTVGFGHENIGPLSEGPINPVPDIFETSERMGGAINCDKFSATKWCQGVDKNSQCLKDFQNFLNDTNTQCGPYPTSACQGLVWNQFFEKYGRPPIDSTCNIGINCLAGTGAYIGCGDSAYLSFLIFAGKSVMGISKETFNPYEAQLLRQALNDMNYI